MLISNAFSARLFSSEIFPLGVRGARPPPNRRHEAPRFASAGVKARRMICAVALPRFRPSGEGMATGGKVARLRAFGCIRTVFGRVSCTKLKPTFCSIMYLSPIQPSARERHHSIPEPPTEEEDDDQATNLTANA
jgi:hypothetical protein